MVDVPFAVEQAIIAFSVAVTLASSRIISVPFKPRELNWKERSYLIIAPSF